MTDVAVKTKNKGLGKGLSALISEINIGADTPVAGAANAAGIRELPLGLIKPGVFQPRHYFNQTALQELADSIEKNGVMQPIIVRGLAQTVDGEILPASDEIEATEYQIIAGERRWRAAKMAGLEFIPVIVKDISDQEALEVALIENIQRQDLTALEEAEGYQRLIDEFDYTQEVLAASLGKSRSHLANMLRLLTLPQEIKDMLNDERLTAGHARALLKAPDPVAYAQEVVKRGLNVRQTERLVQQPLSALDGKESISKRAERERDASGSGVKDPDIMAIEQSLTEQLGMKVVIDENKYGGELRVRFHNLEQLDILLQRLGS